MKAIISHDIDHITVWEHLLKDSILPKFIARSNIELVAGKISIHEFVYRITDFFRNKWQQIDELTLYNKSMGIPSSFFIAVQKGLGLSYKSTLAAYWMGKIKDTRSELGLHGIAYDNIDSIKKEYTLFKDLSGLDHFGGRMHYIRNNNMTLLNMALAGYTYDSTEHSFQNPYKIGNMWEFPFQIMDGWLIERGKRWQSQSLAQAIENTKIIIEKSYAEKLNYICIDFHDRYFSKSFKTWMSWYIWLTNYLKQNKIDFINFEDAIIELEDRSNITTVLNNISYNSVD